jgi:hypothetical protein
MAVTKSTASAQQKYFDESIEELRELCNDSFSHQLRDKNLRMHNATPDPEDDFVNDIEASEYDASGKKTFIPKEKTGRVEIYPPIA